MKMEFNKTKIIATYGPACSDESVMGAMIDAGVDVFRFNFSHGDHEFHREGFAKIKTYNKLHKTKIAILADIQGPKIRVGEVENNGIELIEGAKIKATSVKQITTKDLIYISYEHLAQDVKVGENLLMDDGKMKCQVVEILNDKEILLQVIEGGILSSKKGVNMPETNTTVPSITPKDWEDLKFAVENRANWIALSFVRTAQDVITLKEWLGEKSEYTKIIAKIEKPEAVENIDSIIEVSDAIMVARGDLAIEIPMERVPLVQKSIAKKCNKVGKPVVIATQMMESMTTFSTPTRAEITDVANGVIDGADALMLSGETSVGKHPVKVIETMSKIISNVENADIIYNKKKLKTDPKSESYIPDSVCFNSVRLAEELNAKAILGMTRSGYTAFRVSSFRPKAGIYIFTDNKPLLYTFSLIWGVKGFFYEGFEGTDETINDTIEILKREKRVAPGDIVINTASMPLYEKSKTNTLKVTVVKEDSNEKELVYDNI
jgi:pyruvate kinase